MRECDGSRAKREFWVHVQIGVGYVRAPGGVRSDVSPPPVGLSQLVTSVMKMASTLPASTNRRRRWRLWAFYIGATPTWLLWTRRQQRGEPERPYHRQRNDSETPRTLHICGGLRSHHGGYQLQHQRGLGGAEAPGLGEETRTAKRTAPEQVLDVVVVRGDVREPQTAERRLRPVLPVRRAGRLPWGGVRRFGRLRWTPGEQPLLEPEAVLWRDQLQEGVWMWGGIGGHLGVECELTLLGRRRELRGWGGNIDPRRSWNPRPRRHGLFKRRRGQLVSDSLVLADVLSVHSQLWLPGRSCSRQMPGVNVFSAARRSYEVEGKHVGKDVVWRVTPAMPFHVPSQ